MIFLPNNPDERKKTKKIFEAEALNLGLISKSWREVPVNPDVLCPQARENAPFIEQWLVQGNSKENNIENLLFRLRKRIQKYFAKIEQTISEEPYIASLSNRTVVYKGMVRSEILSEFYKDLKSCHRVMDDIISSELNVEEIFTDNNTRFLKMNIRQAHQEGSIYWVCKKKINFN